MNGILVNGDIILGLLLEINANIHSGQALVHHYFSETVYSTGIQQSGSTETVEL